MKLVVWQLSVASRQPADSRILLHGVVENCIHKWSVQSAERNCTEVQDVENGGFMNTLVMR